LLAGSRARGLRNPSAGASLAALLRRRIVGRSAMHFRNGAWPASAGRSL